MNRGHWTQVVAPLFAMAGLAAVRPAMAQDLPTTFELKPVEAAMGEGEVLRGESGLLPVRLVRSDADSRTIHVEVFRFHRSTDATPGVPPIFILNGGPGFQGLAPSLRNPEFVRGNLGRLAEVADVVVIGQRGIGSSPPNTVCDPPAPPAAGSEPTRASRDIAIADALARCRKKWEAEGYDLGGFNVIEAAGDVADVARALGYDRIQLLGGSFGSHWGMAVLRFHPELVARAVLSSLEGPDHTYDDPAGVLAALERVAAVAELDPDLAPFLPAEGLIEGLRALIRDLVADPLSVTLPDGTTEVRIEADDVRNLAMGYSGRVSSRAGIRTWPADILRLLHGEWAAVVPRIVFGRRSYGILPTASFFMLDCGSGVTPARHTRYSTDPALEIIGDPGAFYDATCPAWGADLGDAFRTGFSTPAPTVLVHGTWDTSTPLENAHELAPMFTNSRLVIVEGGSHGAMGEAFAAEPSFRAAVSRFMETGSFDGIPDRIVLPPLDFAVPAIER